MPEIRAHARRPATRLPAAGIAAALSLSLLVTLALVAPPGTAGAAEGDGPGEDAPQRREGVIELQAASPVQAAVAWSRQTFADADRALLGRDDAFPDNLASGLAQGRGTTPLLLTDGETLSAATADELERLGVSEVVVLGGAQAVSEEVVEALGDAGYETRRWAGATRVETALVIAAQQAPDAEAAVLSRAFGDPEGDETRAWADALAAGAWAAERGEPVLLTGSETLHPSVEEYLEERPMRLVRIVGGSEAVSAEVEAQLEAMGLTVERVAGPNRFATAAEVAAARGAEDASAASSVVLSEGQQEQAWADGFAAAAYAAANAAPLVLANVELGQGLPPETETFLEPGGAGVGLACGPLTLRASCDAGADLLDKPEPVTATDAPELLAAEVVATAAEEARARLWFDAALDGDTIDRDGGGLWLSGADTARALAEATEARPDPDHPRAVLADFAREAFDRATTAAIGHDAVRDVHGRPSPEAAAGLQAVSYAAARTDGPDLVGVTDVDVGGGQTTATLRFDAPAANENPTGYRLVLADGTTVTGTLEEGDGTESHTVTFLNEHSADDRRRVAVLAGTVSGGSGGALTNPVQVIDVGDDGATEVPDLVAVDVDAGADEITYRFDEGISPPTLGFEAGDFTAAFLDGTEASGQEIVDDAGEEITVGFADDALTAAVTAASVDAGAVVGENGANAVDAAGIARGLDAGELLAPRLVVGAAEALSLPDDDPVEVELTLGFDVAVARESGFISEAVGDVVGYTAAGERLAAEDCEADGDELVCTLTHEPGAGPVALVAVQYAAAANDDPPTPAGARPVLPSNALVQ